jgi:hypothetical protein
VAALNASDGRLPRADGAVAPVQGLGRDAAAELLLSCLNVDRWAQAILDTRPHPNLHSLLELGRTARTR